MCIYLPPGYDSSPRLRYPVLYLQHGAGPDLFSYLGTFSGTPMALAQAQVDAVAARFRNRTRLSPLGPEARYPRRSSSRAQSTGPRSRAEEAKTAWC
jgi:hypothetical protein